MASSIEILAPSFLEELAESALLSLEQQAKGEGFKVVHRQRSPEDPNIYIGVGKEVTLSALAESLRSLSLSLPPLATRSNQKLRPLMIYVYDQAQPAICFRLPEDIDASLSHFDR